MFCYVRMRKKYVRIAIKFTDKRVYFSFEFNFSSMMSCMYIVQNLKILQINEGEITLFSEFHLPIIISPERSKCHISTSFAGN